MTTFLEGVQDLARECDLPGVPASVVNQSGEYADLVRWYARALKDIERRHRWRWLRRTATVTTTSGDGVYAPADFTDTTDAAPISRFGSWRIEDVNDPPKIGLTSSGAGGERWLVWTTWEAFKSIYRLGSQVDGAPAHIAIDPANNIVLGPVPNAAYDLTADYIMSPQTLALDADEPGMPLQFHDLILFRAMEKYAYREAAPEVLNRAKEEGRRLLRQLEIDQLERIYWPGPMA
jgi:hypothetical protein